MISIRVIALLLALAGLIPVGPTRQRDQGASDPETLLPQLHASRLLVAEKVDPFEKLLTRCDRAWSDSHKEPWAHEPEGVTQEADALLWLDRALLDPLPGQRSVAKLDRRTIARYLLLARSALPAEAVKLSAPCHELEELVAHMKEKASSAEERTKAYEIWRGTLSEAVIESPKADELSWTGTLNVRVPAGTRVDVYLMGGHMELSVADGEAKAGRYESELAPQAGLYQGIAVVVKDGSDRAVGASRIVWVKGSVEEKARTPDPPAPPVAKPEPAPASDGGSKEAGDPRIPMAEFEGFAAVPNSVPDPVANIHVGAGLIWPEGITESNKRIYPWRIRHKQTGIVMLLVKPGTFLMGSHDPYFDDSSSPGHQVTITRPFYLGETEVTVGQWRVFAQTTGFVTEAERHGNGRHWALSKKRDPRACWSNPLPDESYGFNDRHPVTQVSWDDALAFCGEYGFRLPTEAEWEYACRAGTTSLYWWGNDPRAGQGKGNFADLAFKKRLPEWVDPFPIDDGTAFTAEVGKFQANPWGFRDILGNVSEWCADYYESDFYRRGPNIDPLNTATGPNWHVQRGSNWKEREEASGCESRCMQFGDFPSRYGLTGIRVAMSLEH